MDKKLKRQERPKLRKEDIGIPVNFVHVQHVGLGGQRTGSLSVCTSPTDQSEPFFSQNVRRSDSSLLGGQYPIGKENRFSNSPSMHPYSSMSNLSITSHDKDSIGPMNRRSMKPSKGFSGSLLNLFMKSDKSKNAEATKNKRMSLGVPISTPSSASPSSQNNRKPTFPSPSENTSSNSNSNRHFMRRRSSSFTGDTDFHNSLLAEVDTNAKHGKAPPPPALIRANSTISSWIKKPKISQSFDSPPLSPTLDELPPPPEDMIYSSLPPMKLPESPTYDDLPPPPSYNSESDLPPPPLVIRKESVSSWPTDQFQYNKIPQPFMIERKLSDQSNSPPPLPSTSPPALSSSSSRNFSPSNTLKTSSKLQPALRTKLIRVNAPTLPPLSVPLIRSKKQSPNSPQTWPLEPTFHDLENVYETIDNEPENARPNLSSFSKQIKKGQERKSILEESFPNDKLLDDQHLVPLTKLFQNSITYKQWPKVAQKLFSKYPDPKNDESSSVKAIYSELIRKTLELWLELEGGTASMEQLVTAFEQVQNELSLEVTRM